MYLSVLLEPIKEEFDLNDLQLGLLGGLAFGSFYISMVKCVFQLLEQCFLYLFFFDRLW